jgi:hypothetical protein
MDGLKNFAHGLYKKAAESVTGPLRSSQFEEKRVSAFGTLSPSKLAARV